MRYVTTILTQLCVASMAIAQAEATGATNQTSRETAGLFQLTVNEAVTVRVKSVAASTRFQRLVWVVTFEEKGGTIHNCLVGPNDPFLREIGLDKLTNKEIAAKKDYSGLPWYSIVIGASTKEYRKITSWKRIENGAEQSSGGAAAPQK